MIQVDDPQLLLALSGSHIMVPVVTAMYGTEQVGTVSVVDGAVVFDESSTVQGRCSVTIPVPRRLPPSAFDPRQIDVTGWRLFIEYGVQIGTEVRTVPLGTFVVYDIDDQDDGKLTIVGYDTTVLLRDGRFVAPYSIPAGTSYETALEELAGAIGLEADFPITGYTTPLLLFQEGEDRLQRMQDMASSCGWRVVADYSGVIRAQANAVASGSEAVADFAEGQGSHLVHLARQRTRARVYNAAVVTGEPAGNTAPVYGVAYDLDTSSPTYFYGPFGQVPVFEKSQFVTSTAQANAAAEGLLARKKGFGAALRIESWAHPFLRPGDPVHVARADMGIDQLIPLKSVDFGLVPGRSMRAQTREGIVGIEADA